MGQARAGGASWSEFAFEAGIARLAARFGLDGRRVARPPDAGGVLRADEAARPSGAVGRPAHGARLHGLLARPRPRGRAGELIPQLRPGRRRRPAGAAGAAGRAAGGALSGATGARRAAPELWFTYHLYHKAPDWLGPVGQPGAARSPTSWPRRRSPASRRAGHGRGYAASRAAIAQADLVLAMTEQDLPGLRTRGPGRAAALFPPFLDARPFVAARGRAALPAGRFRHGCCAVAMMRADVKLAVLPPARRGAARLDRPALAACSGRRRRGTARGRGDVRAVRRAGRVCAGRCRRRRCRRSTPPPTSTSGRPATRPTAWRCWRRRRRACRWSPVARAAWPTSSPTAPPACSSSRARRRPSPPRSASLLADPARRRAMGARGAGARAGAARSGAGARAAGGGAGRSAGAGMRICLIRHGSTSWNEAGPHPGADRHPAERLRPGAGARPGGCRRASPVRACVTSPLARARETAALLGFADPPRTRGWPRWPGAASRAGR